MTESIASPEQQLARLRVFEKMKTLVEEKLNRYRHSDLTDSQLAAQVFMSIFDSGVQFYLDGDSDA